MKKGIFLFLVFMTVKSHAAFFTPAIVVKSNNVPYGGSSQSTRIEWWAYVSFTIDQKGIPSDVEFINASARTKRLYKTTVEKFIQGLEFQPATYDGVPVLSNSTMLYRYDISFYGSANDGVSISYKNQYNEVDHLMHTNNLKAAKDALIILEEDHSKNIIEQSLTAWIKSNYFYKVSAWKQYGEEVEKAFLLREFLPKKLAIKAIRNSTDYLFFKKHYVSALTSAAVLKSVKGVSNGEEAYKAYYDEITVKLDEESELKNSYSLQKNLSRYIWVNKKDLTVTVNTGNLSKLQLRCLKSKRTLPLGNEVKFTIADDESECALIVSGSDDLKFSIVEQGDSLLESS